MCGENAWGKVIEKLEFIENGVGLSLVTCGERLGKRFWVFSRNSVRLVEFGSGGIQVEDLTYGGCRLGVRGCFLKQNCFLIVWMRWLGNF